MLARSSIKVDDARALVRQAAASPGCAEHLLASLRLPVAVVGNATPNREWGAVIDRYTTVIRLNNFRIQGFERWIGRRTSVWCTSGWEDVEPRANLAAISPFTADAPESLHLAGFNRRNGRVVLAARTDVRCCIPEVDKPSTGMTLAQLLDMLGVQADLFCFDGFRSPHYWAAGVETITTHSSRELDALTSRQHLALHSHGAPSKPGSAAAEPARIAEHPERLLAVLDRAGILNQGPARVLSFGETSSELMSLLAARGLQTTSIDPRREAASGQARSLTDAVLDLAVMDSPFDVCLAVDVLDRLAENDVRVFVRHAARQCSALVTTVPVDRAGQVESIRPTRSVEWWRQMLGTGFDVRAEAGVDDARVVLFGNNTSPLDRRSATVGRHTASSYGLPPGYTSRTFPEYYEDLDGGTVWQPDVYRLLRDLVHEQGCRRVVDIGCGRGRKLAALYPELDIVGVDWGTNLEHCRAAYPWGRWIEANLERPQRLALDLQDLAEAGLVCADVIEHLIDPDGLLATLRELLDVAPFALLSTPERQLTHGAHHDGPPPNPAHVREWSLDELRAYATDRGFEVAFAGLTASNSDSYERNTSLLVLMRHGSDQARSGAIGERVGSLLDLYDRERGTGHDGRMSIGQAPVSGAERSKPSIEPSASESGVSIVMRTKDRPHLLARAISSVVAQTWPLWHLLVVNDAGDALTVDTVVGATARGFESQVSVIHRTVSEGMEAATNAGIEAATDRFIALLDDDDTWEPTFLETCVTHLLGQSGSPVRGVVTHSTRVVERSEGKRIEEQAREPFTPSLTAISLAQLTQRNLFPVNSFVYERSALDRVGLYRAHLPVLGDWDFNLRFVRHFDIDVIPLALANYHIRPQSASGTYANSPHALHLAFDAKIRNELLRADLDAGVFGLGLLANLGPLLVDRDASQRHAEGLARERDALVREREALAQQAQQMQTAWQAQLASQWEALHEPLVRNLIARVRRAHVRSVTVIGAGDLGLLIASQLAEAAIRCVAVGDNDERKWGTVRLGLVVTSVADALVADADAVVVASVAHHRSLRTQVRRHLSQLRVKRRVFGPAG